MANKVLAFAQTTIKSIKDVKSLDLTASRQAIAYDKDNNAKDTTAITLTATQQNFNSAITWSTTPSVTLGGSGNTRTLAVSNFNNNNQIKVNIESGGLSDTVTIVKIKDGATGATGSAGKDSYTIVLSNESQTIATDTGLKPLTATTYNCIVTVYRGTTKLTATNSTPGTNQFKVTLPSNPTGITLGQSTAGTITFATTTSTAISANGNINLNIQINGISETFTKTISYSASKQGNTGATGAAGSHATAYWLISSASAIGKNLSNVFNPTSVTFSLKSQTGTNAVANYSGRLIIAESTDGTNFTDKYTSSANETSKTYSPSSTSVKSIRVRMYQAGGTSVLLDEQIIPIVTDGKNGTNGTNGSNGAPAVTAVLSNDSHTIPCNTSGTPTTYAGAVTTMSVFVGASDTSSSWTYSVATSNVSGTASNNNRTYTVTGISADTGYVDITASRSGYSSVTKRFSLAKAKQGATGGTGPQGPQGPQGEALDTYDGTFTEGIRFWSTKYDSYSKPGTNVVTKSANTSKYGGKTLKIQNDTWLYSKNPIAIEDGRIYKFIFRVRQLQNPTNDSTKNKIYAGATEFNHGGTKVSQNNGNYFVVSSATCAVSWKSVNGDSAPATYNSAKDDQYQWLEYVAYMSTTAKEAIKHITVTGAEVVKFPAVKAFTANTKFIKPMFIVNYSGGNGIAEVDSLIVKDVTEEYEAAKNLNNTKEIFDKITNEGKKQGLFTDNNGKVYVNGEYINAKNLTVRDNSNNVTFGVDVNGNVTIKPKTFALAPSGTNQTTIVNLLNNNNNSTSNTNGIFLNGTTLNINATNIKAGKLSAISGGSYFDLNNGSMLLGNTSGNNYLQWTGSELKIKASSMSIGTTSVATTTNVNNAVKEVTNKIESITVGGTNLLRCSNMKNNNTTYGWTNFSGDSAEGLFGTSYRHYNNKSATSGYVDFLQQIIYKQNNNTKFMKPSTWYTFSFYSKGSGKIKTHIYPDIIDTSVKGKVDSVETTLAGDGAYDWTLTSSWVRHTYTFKTKATLSANDNKLLFRLYYGNEVYICAPQLEEGNKVSDWSLAIADIEVDASNKANSAVNNAVGVKDTRNDNQNPQWYFTNYPKRTVQEFKFATVVGIPGAASGVYGILETKVP